MISRRSFLGTLAAAIAAGFTKVENVILDRGTATDFLWDDSAPRILTRWRVDPHCPVNMVFYINRDTWCAFEGDSGEPTPLE